MDYFHKLIIDIELHSVEGIRECFENGISPNEDFRDEPLIYELISEYTRSPRFKDCVKAFVDYGLAVEDKALLAVLMDDVDALQVAFEHNSNIGNNKYTLRSAYTPLHEVSLLHICAEFNHIGCAKVLVGKGIDVNVKAGVDEHGLGGQTPVFHTVNQNSNQSREMLDFLLSRSADLTTTVKGLIWGKGYEWETLIPAVNPISYAMMGLLPQMHRSETAISRIVSMLMNAAYGIDYKSSNIPNAYLKKNNSN